MVQKSLIVGVRVRPLLETEKSKSDQRDILRVLDSKMVIVLDPDERKGYLDQLANRSKEKRYTFDSAFPTSATNRMIYDGTLKDLVSGVMDGLNGTVFAYGATGSGKTHTMVGTSADPGLMVLSLQQLFAQKETRDKSEQVTVTCSYLEVYNEVIYDLLVKSSSPLELREDPSQGVQVAGLTKVTVKNAEDIMNEVQALKTRLEDKTATATAVDDQLSWIDSLASEINENVEERINLQKALFELEDVNVCNKFELKNINDYLEASDLTHDEQMELSDRKQNILENIRENEEAGAKYRTDIDANEACRYEIQHRIEDGMEQYKSAAFLKILSTFRLQAVRLQEFQFQMAIRDQIITEQRNVIKNLWNVMEYSGLDKESILEIAQNEGIVMDHYMDSGNRAPSVGASDLLSLLNSERFGHRTVLARKPALSVSRISDGESLEQASTPSPRSSIASQRQQEPSSQQALVFIEESRDRVRSRSQSRRAADSVDRDNQQHPQRQTNGFVAGRDFVLQGSALQNIRQKKTKVKFIFYQKLLAGRREY
eukprot:g4444.t1